MSLGSIKNLYTALTIAPSLSGASVLFGEEEEFAKNVPMPYRYPVVLIMPVGGPFKRGQGYIKDADETIDIIWSCDEAIDIAVWNVGANGANSLQIDNADATEDTAGLVLQALENQRPSGLTYVPVNRRWQRMSGALSRYGRSLVLTVQAEIPIPGATGGTTIPSAVDITTTIVE